MKRPLPSDLPPKRQVKYLRYEVVTAASARRIMFNTNCPDSTAQVDELLKTGVTVYEGSTEKMGAVEVTIRVRKI